MKKLGIIIVILLSALDVHGVLKEKNLEQTLNVLRNELTDYHLELTNMASARKQETRNIIHQLQETIRRSNQNALMLYSQQSNYVFDLTYACHEATEQYAQFQRQQLPFKSFIETTNSEIAKYDSLVNSLKVIHIDQYSQQAKNDWSVCLTLATNIRNSLTEESNQVASYISLYEMTEQQLRSLNDYANKRYKEIQTGIFRNGGENYFSVLRNIGSRWHNLLQTIAEKYKPSSYRSDWNSTVILQLFLMIAFYFVVAILLNLLVFRFMPKRFHTQEFLRKRTCIILATTTITFAAIIGILRATLEQNFFLMASGLLIEYSWLLSVILISLLLRVSGSQIKGTFHVYAPLIVVGFIVIAFRIVLIPNELVNMVFPIVLLLCTLWQWRVIRHHNGLIPKADAFYSYLSLAIFILSLGFSWFGYTLLSVQMLIWWIMQLACILTINCISSYLKLYSKRHGFDNKPITQSWFFLFLYKVVLPTIGVCSVMLSIYWAADVFNLGDLAWQIFKTNFINLDNLKVSIMKLSMVVVLWFLFSYMARTILALMRLHFNSQDPTTAASREVMGKNVVQVLIWGIWLLVSLSLFNISVTWLLAISGGLSTGIGFASKDIIENIYYGATLMAGRVKVGDWIEVDGTMGKVASISYTSTVVESLYGEVITFQNSQLFAKNYKNLTKNHGYVLAVIPFGVAYGSDIKQVTQVIEEAVNAMHHQWMDPEKRVKSVMSGLGDSSVDFKLFVWADAVKKAYVISDVLKVVYNTLSENNIQIPFPQRDVTIKNFQPS